MNFDTFTNFASVPALLIEKLSISKLFFIKGKCPNGLEASYNDDRYFKEITYSDFPKEEISRYFDFAKCDDNNFQHRLNVFHDNNK